MTAAAQFLEDPEVRARVSAISVEQYQTLPEFNENHKRTELIRGVILEKVSKSPLHSRIGSRLYDLLRVHVPDGCWLRKEEPVQLSDSVPEPDLSLVVGAEADFNEEHPSTALLVVEVAVSSVAADRALAAIYAEAGIAEYWVILLRQREVEVYRQPEHGRYLQCISVADNRTLSCESLPAVQVSLDALFD